jgi:hypothetical protein
VQARRQQREQRDQRLQCDQGVHAYAGVEHIRPAHGSYVRTQGATMCFDIDRKDSSPTWALIEEPSNPPCWKFI